MAKGLSLKWKVPLVIVSGALIAGITITILVVQLVSGSLQSELTERGKAIVTTLSKQVERPLVGDDEVDIQNLVDIASGFTAVSYVYISDKENKVVAQKFKVGSYNQRTMVEAAVIDGGGDYKIDLTQVENTETYEISTPIGAGTLGNAHVGMSGKFIDDTIRATALLVGGVLALAVVFGMIVALYLSNALTKQLLYLTESAEQISKGDLESIVRVEATDEIGDLADAIERLRESLKAAIERLRKKKAG
ncbi:cell wall metabolism sensor histidine kinase WalK [bacterium]|nr:cell wall metabolism sensor histidine kinase WalK [bacterium]NUN45879.1 HAMP domain-containing protein [bacterium]HND78317.1 HAMP domain-containing protein [bacterium]HNE83786.1 HAMP domain-containing protein [bacterium]HNO92307.1 HAMP domain-containing protein [bacterium]